MTCDYAGSPCGTTARCSGGTWLTETSCPPADECPASLPADGDPCTLTNPVVGSLRCHYGACPSGTLAGPEQRAECDGSTWSVAALECAPAVDCGECPPGTSCGAECGVGQTCGRNQCRQGEVCMRMLYQGGDWAWDCAPNACDPQALDCSCVGNICAQRGLPGDWQCTAAAAPAITCECTSC